MTSLSMKSRVLFAALATCALPTTAAIAQDSQGIQPLEWNFRDHTAIQLYGQINKGILTFDDGDESTSYGLVDNDNSSTRLGITSTTNFDSGWEMFSNIEFEYQPHASNTVNQLDKNGADYGFDKTNFRKAEIAFSSERVGKFWLGQGSMASDGTAETDLSGTGVIAYSSVSDIGGGLFREDDGTLSNVTTSGAYSNLDGLGRKMRVRYDTPTFSGFTLKASYGQDTLNDDDDSLYDIAATYAADYNTVEVAASVGYARDEGDDADILSASFSTLHTPTGLSFTLAGGQNDADVNASYGYAKLGLEREFFAVGSTAFSVDYYDGQDISSDGADSTSYAFAMVQNVDNWNSQWYVSMRQFEYDDDVSDYEDGLSTMAGLRIKF
ncbi:porin [Amaricoccus macauensis]|uniref:porin n=1 Tax=Amaricoccus macauensis TaxID=57001 RepID=UPI003C7DBA6A